MPEFAGALSLIMMVAILVPVLLGLRHWKSTTSVASDPESAQAANS